MLKLTELECNVLQTELRKMQTEQLKDLNFPEAKEWMWNYCIPLGKYKYVGQDDKVQHMDLGVHITTFGISAAIVCSNKIGDYLSGRIEVENIEVLHHYVETKERFLKLLGQHTLNGWTK